MRVAVLYYAENKKKLLKKLSEALARGLEKQGHNVDILSADDFNRKLAIYQAVAVGTESTGFLGGRIPVGFSKYLASIGPVVSLKTFAFVSGKSLRSHKSLLSLMKIMEAEGMFILSSEVLEKVSEAELIAKSIIID